MKEFYFQLFRRVHSWSARQEFDGKPSLYSAVIYISALQLLNILTIFFISDYLRIGYWDFPKWTAAVVPMMLFICNWRWATRIEGSLTEKKDIGPNGRKLAVNGYISATIVAFLASGILYVYSAPPI